ncbi:MAG: uroporphyrinogen decarboxylase [Francisellaceae bacterium]
MRTLFLDALSGKNVARTPLWIMRQAGRYLPEYRKTRSRFPDFMAMCRNAEACTEVALQPLDRFDLDASIVFSDILTIPEALGMKLNFVTGTGPVFESPITCEKDIAALKQEGCIERLRYVYDAVAATKKALDSQLPLIGFAGSPWTLASYMIEGSGSKQFTRIRKMMYENGVTLQSLLKMLSEIISGYLIEQINHGADAIMLFDSWGGLLTPETYPHFSLAYMNEIIRRLKRTHPHIPVIIYTKGGGLWLDQMAASNADAIGLDWSINIAKARQIIGMDKTIQGNLDPAALYGSDELIDREVKRIFSQLKHNRRFVFNLGHGIYPDIDPARVKTLVDLVKKYGNDTTSF